MKFITSFFGQGHANQSASIRRHEINDFWRYHFRCADEIPFVFSVLVVNDDNHSTFADVRSGLLNGGKGHIDQFQKYEICTLLVFGIILPEKQIIGDFRSEWSSMHTVVLNAYNGFAM